MFQVELTEEKHWASMTFNKDAIKDFIADQVPRRRTILPNFAVFLFVSTISYLTELLKSFPR